MEIQLLLKQSLRIKGKHSSLVIDPQEKAAYNAAVLITLPREHVKIEEDVVVIQGAGEYEIGGIKMTGLQAHPDTIYSMNVDGIAVVIGKIGALERMQHKLKDHNIVIIVCDMFASASFATSLADNTIVFYGEKAAETAQSFGKENIKQMGKYVTTLEKLPAEVETILLV